MCVTLQASRARLEAAVQQSMQHNVNQWAVAEVCDWSDYIGLGQYRKKFVHHCVDGRLLLRLSDRDLKVSKTQLTLHVLQCVRGFCCDKHHCRFAALSA